MQPSLLERQLTLQKPNFKVQNVYWSWLHCKSLSLDEGYLLDEQQVGGYAIYFGFHQGQSIQG